MLGKGRVLGRSVGPLTLLPEADYADYDAFVEASAHGTIFQTSWWYRAWGLDFDCLASRRHGAFCTGLLVGRARRGGRTIFAVPPLTPYHGPVIELPQGLAPADAHGWRKQEMLRVIAGLPPGLAMRFHPTPDQFDFSPYVWAGFEAEPSLTYRIRRETGTDWRRHGSRGTREALDRAQRRLEESGGTVSRARRLDQVLHVFEATAGRQGFSLAAGLDRCWRTVEARAAGALYAARDSRGEVVCAALTVHDRKAVFYLVGGVDPEARSRSVMTAVMARMIDDALSAGRDFDFEGSLLVGVERFFRGFGGDLVPLVRIYPTPRLQAGRSDLARLAERMGVAHSGRVRLFDSD